MGSPTDFLVPVKWVSWAEMRALYEPPDMERIGFHEGFSLYRHGERESPQSAGLREALQPVYDDRGRLTGMRPKGGDPSIEETMRSIDLMVRWAT